MSPVRCGYIVQGVLADHVARNVIVASMIPMDRTDITKSVGGGGNLCRKMRHVLIRYMYRGRKTKECGEGIGRSRSCQNQPLAMSGSVHTLPCLLEQRTEHVWEHPECGGTPSVGVPRVR